MEYSVCYKGIITTTSLSPPSPPPSSSSSSFPDSPPPDLPPAAVTLSPSSSFSAVYPPEMVAAISSCGPCKHVGRSCTENCVLAAYFPPNDLLKFTIVDRVFGAGNIINFLQELPEFQRADAVSSMVYEANARLRDPVYGCAGAIYHLQKQVSDLQAQLAKAQAEVVNMQCQQTNLIQLVCMEMDQSPQASPQQSMENFTDIPMSFLDDNNSFGLAWEPLWT